MKANPVSKGVKSDRKAMATAPWKHAGGTEYTPAPGTMVKGGKTYRLHGEVGNKPSAYGANRPPNSIIVQRGPFVADQVGRWADSKPSKVRFHVWSTYVPSGMTAREIDEGVDKRFAKLRATQDRKAATRKAKNPRTANLQQAMADFNLLTYENPKPTARRNTKGAFKVGQRIAYPQLPNVFGTVEAVEGGDLYTVRWEQSQILQAHVKGSDLAAASRSR
jgi:hypothetical protein